MHLTENARRLTVGWSMQTADVSSTTSTLVKTEAVHFARAYCHNLLRPPAKTGRMSTDWARLVAANHWWHYPLLAGRPILSGC